MKYSGVSWIGQIPDSWSVAPLYFFLDKRRYAIVDGPFGSDMKNEEYVDDGVPIVQLGNIRENRHNLAKVNYITDEKADSLMRHNALAGDIAIAKMMPAARACILNEKYPRYVVSADVIKASVSDPYLKKFIVYCLNAYCVDMSEALTNGSTRARINLSIAKKFPIPNIALYAVREIVEFLDKKCAKIDSLIAGHQAIIEKLKEYKQSVIYELVTKGLNPYIRFKDSGIEWLGKIPEHWSINRIGNLYTDTSEPGDASLPILSVSINNGVSDKELSDEDSDRLFVRSEDRSKYKKVRPGDLTYNMMRAWQGAFGAVRVNGMVSPAYIVARPKATGIDTRYIEALMRTPHATEEMHRYSHGIADFRLRLYWPEFKNIKICVPDFSEQQQIADFIDMRSAEIDSSIATRESIIAKLTEYKKSLIYEVVTGKKEV